MGPIRGTLRSNGRGMLISKYQLMKAEKVPQLSNKFEPKWTDPEGK